MLGITGLSLMWLPASHTSVEQPYGKATVFVAADLVPGNSEHFYTNALLHQERVY